MKKMFAKYTGQDVLKLTLMLCILVCGISFLVLPLLFLFVQAFYDKQDTFVGFQLFVQYFTSPNMLLSLTNTIYIAVISTTISVTLAFMFAYCLSRKQIKWKQTYQMIAMLPLFAPTMLLGMSLVYLFGNKGLLTQLGWVIPLKGALGIIIAESIYCFPVALMLLTVAFSAADNRLYEAADVMGTSSLKKMWTITLPSVKYGLINAIFVCFTYSFTDFGAPAVVGGNYNVLATDVYKQVIGQQNFNMGAVVGVMMMFPTVVSFIVDKVISAKQASAISSRSVPFVIKSDHRSDLMSQIFCTAISILLILFFGVSLYGSLVTSWPYNMTLSLKHYDFTNVGAGAGLSSIIRSLQVSAMVAVLGTLIAFMTAYLIEKINVFPRLRRLIYFISITQSAVPGTVIGLSYILFFNPKVFMIPNTSFGIVNSFHVLYGSTAILIVVNIVHYFAVPFITARTSLKRLDREFETVSDSLGVPFYKTLLRITVPMSLPAFFEMMVYFFMNSMVTVSAVIFLYTPMTKLASVVVLNVSDAGDDAAAAALCMLILAINVMVRLLYEITDRWLKR